MTEIASSSLTPRLEANVLALKQQLQREAEAATALVEQAVQPAGESAPSGSQGNHLVDIFV